MNLPVSFLAAIYLASILAGGCSDTSSQASQSVNYRDEMRRFVENISLTARSQNPDFIVIPQNGLALLTSDGMPGGPPVTDYIGAIDAVAQEDLFYGYDEDNQATPSEVTAELQEFLNLAMKQGLGALAIDYCWDEDKITCAGNLYSQSGYIGFAANRRELDEIPGPLSNENDSDVDSIHDVNNFLYLINPSENFGDRDEFIDTLASTNYDLLIIDAFYDDQLLSKPDVEKLRKKANGGRRLVLAYMSIGEAEDYRWYWKSEWEKTPPEWLGDENPEWEGNYKVHYWDKDWQSIILGSYLNKIMSASFDGVYLDLIDAFEYYEK
jgi:cysteinyl-tRNA synthetase, unknown class